MKEIGLLSFPPHVQLKMTEQLDPATDSKAWDTVTQCLMNNRCWLCEEIFPRGKVKKVFEVSDLLNYCNARMDTVKEGSGDIPAILCRNLTRVFNRYSAINGDLKTIECDLEAVNMAPWMSGLVCLRNTNCTNDYNLITMKPPPNSDGSKGEEGSDDSIPPPEKVAGWLPPGFMRKEDCPPGCDCDNPWPFLSEKLGGMVSKQAQHVKKGQEEDAREPASS